MNREKLTKIVLDEIRRIKKERGFDISELPDKERSKWIEHLVRQFWE